MKKVIGSGLIFTLGLGIGAVSTLYMVRSVIHENGFDFEEVVFNKEHK